ncbi:kinase-like domain-containing protein [Chaetomium tenue]|uniref:Kinase-like domain-containing protein n=1 Tax=Chaetomium tenue TaxID=1854479 RepID=A0ACB7PEL8_9PEZI|nr:kinase-like domain-containing protein [Chaetomium globosum]
MSELGDGGWRTVMPTSHAGMKRLPHSQLEECERKILEDWEASRHHWSGIGKHLPLDDFTEARKLHDRLKVACDTPLGSGSFGVVQKVQFHCNNRSICLARKQVRPPYRRYPMCLLREEANVMERLDHDHIVKLVGTYCIQTNLYLLLWPVAVCNLDILLNDIDSLRTNDGDRDDIINRLHALGLGDLTAIEPPRSTVRTAAKSDNCPLEYLRRIMGCITRAVAYCHGSNIRHLDLKPSNILLNPGRVYLADFGIAKDVHDRENTMTRGLQGTPKWRAPELHQSKTDWSMKAADVYSLGLILLNIFTVIYNAPLDEFDALLGDVSVDGRAEKLERFLPKLEGLALASQEVDDANAPTFGPKHIVDLASRMVSKEPGSRPVIFQVDSELVELGGLDQVYHFQCCKRSSRFLTERINTKLKVVAEERDRLRVEHEQMAKRLQVLEARDETYERRLENERRTHAENITKLQAQLDKERAGRKMADELLTEMQQNRKQRRPVGPYPSANLPPSNLPSPGGLMMRTHPKSNLQPAAAPRQQPPATQIQQPSPAPSVIGDSPRLSYSQCVKGSTTSKASALAAPLRRDSLIPSPSPSPGPISASIPSPELAGFTLRSRKSGSRLPLAVNPATPIRTGTPITHQDLSSTDSTQYSMSDSVFSRLSLSKVSVAGTSVSGTPPTTRSPAVANMRREESPTAVPKSPRYGEPGPETPPSPDVPHGLGLGLTDRERRESIVSGTGDGESIRDTASVTSSAAFPPSGMLSPVLSGSALSSPRAAYASADTARRDVPSLPTAQSWADVARRQRKG